MRLVRLAAHPVKHATDRALDCVDGLLADIRALSGLDERKRGVFYRKSCAFLHFHEHGEDVYMDVRLEGPDFERIRVTTAAECKRALAKLRAHLNAR